MNKKLYVGGLSASKGEDEVREAFEKVGEVDRVEVILDRDTGRSRGFAFVTMQTEEAAQKAIDEFDSKPHELAYGDQGLRVNEARERERNSSFRSSPPRRSFRSRY